MRPVSIIGIGQVPVQKEQSQSLRRLGASVVRQAMLNAGVDRVDALYAANMLGSELQGQKQIAALLADEAGLPGIEALHVGAATAAGAAALRTAYLAVASGAADLVVAVGVEKMSGGVAAPALAKALDAEQEVPVGDTLISKNAELMRRYMTTYNVPEDGLAHFAVNAHRNARHNLHALYRQQTSVEQVMASRLIHHPIRLFDCSPICDGAAAVVLAPRDQAHTFTDRPVHLLGASVATDRFRLADRDQPLLLAAARLSAQRALAQAGVTLADIDFYEVHDAFSIMACLLLEAVGFAQTGEGWRLAAEQRIYREGEIPIATMGGLKARGHPIGATALYQTCEIVLQLTGRAGQNQLPEPEIALMHSVGGAGTTIVAHVFGNQ
jgi:acetyl-CoA C-acetyltransferase